MKDRITVKEFREEIKSGKIKIESKRIVFNDKIKQENNNQLKSPSKKKNNKYNTEKTEEQLQIDVSVYLRSKYPDILFNVDMSGVKLPIGLAKKIKALRSNRAYPDMVIYAKRKNYCGMFLELKKETPYKKDGTLKNQKVKTDKGIVNHLQEQKEMIDRLRKEGYYADFFWDFETIKKTIDWYLKD